MSFNRSFRRKQEQKVTMEDRAKEALARQYIDRLNKVQMKIRERWMEVVPKNLHPVPKWLSNHVPPKWYMRTAFFLFMDLPRMFSVWLVNLGLPLSLIALIRLPITITTTILALIFLKPCKWFRGYMGHFGMQLRINKLEKFVVQYEIFKWGRVIDEGKLEV
jgi:hypothetical protein